MGFHEILPQTDFSVEMGCVRTEFFYDLQSGGPLEIEILRYARSTAKKNMFNYVQIGDSHGKINLHEHNDGIYSFMVNLLERTNEGALRK